MTRRAGLKDYTVLLVIDHHPPETWGEIIMAAKSPESAAVWARERAVRIYPEAEVWVLDVIKRVDQTQSASL